MSQTDSAHARRDRSGVYFLAACLVSLAAAWYLLKELDVLLRPLFLAVLIAYIIVPIHNRLRRRVPLPVATIVLAAGTVGLLLGVAEVINANVRQLQRELPRLTARGTEIAADVRHYFDTQVPWLTRVLGTGGSDAPTHQEEIVGVARGVLSSAAGALGEALVVALYLTFMLVEAGRFPRRVQQTFPTDKARAVQSTIEAINTRIGRYLRAKVQSSLILAAPVMVILLAFGVKFATLWGLLTFLFNFVPYIGSVLGFGLPTLFAFLDLPSPGTAAVVAALILACHLTSASFVEPRLLGRAVGLPPMVILMSLTFWGLCWGFGGMLLAVPLTVMVKIVMEHVDATRPVARLLSDD